jgi:uncharacterized protein with HEPN domain
MCAGLSGLPQESNFVAFSENEEKIFAVRAAFIELSEAAIRLGAAAGRLCPGIPWRDVRGIGNHLRHGYDSIDLERLWNSMTEDLPVLGRAVTEALSRIQEGSTRPLGDD